MNVRHGTGSRIRGVFWYFSHVLLMFHLRASYRKVRGVDTFKSSLV